MWRNLWLLKGGSLDDKVQGGGERGETWAVMLDLFPAH